MFGHQDDKHDHKDDEEEIVEPDTSQDQPATDAGVDHGAGDQAQTDQPDDHGAGGPPADTAEGSDNTPISDDDAWQHPGENLDDGPEHISDITPPPGGHPHNPTPPPMPADLRDMSDDDAKTPHELIDIKQKALGELQPLLGQLDQSPEDRFRTLMMIIQASDNQDMIKQAYDVAEDIKDDKTRAQALLDLVNEINYFTQHPSS